jgi:hypothetical protein
VDYVIIIIIIITTITSTYTHVIECASSEMGRIEGKGRSAG